MDESNRSGIPRAYTEDTDSSWSLELKALWLRRECLPKKYLHAYACHLLAPALGDLVVDHLQYVGCKLCKKAFKECIDDMFPEELRRETLASKGIPIDD